MATQLELLESGKGCWPEVYMYVDPFVKTDGTIDFLIGPDPNKRLRVPAGIPYPKDGGPIYMGLTEEPVDEDPGAKGTPKFDRNNRVPSDREYKTYEPTIKATVIWSGDEGIKSVLILDAIQTSAGGSAGPVLTRRKHKLLMVYRDRFKPGVFECKLYKRVTFDPVRTLSGWMPRKFNMLAHVLLGKDANGCPLQTEMQFYDRFYVNAAGLYSMPDGSAITIEPSAFPVMAGGPVGMM